MSQRFLCFSLLTLLALVGYVPTGCLPARAWAGWQKESESAALKLYLRACGHVARGHPELAVASLRESLEFGYPHPMQVISDSCFVPLLALPEWRPALRELLRQNAWEDSAVMVSPHEPGERIQLEGLVTEEGTGKPISQAEVELIQADSKGLYFAEEGPWNPRLFAYLLTGDSGRITVETILPGPRTTDSGGMVPAPVHFKISRAGFATLAGEFVFSDDSLPATENSSRGPSGPVFVASRLGLGTVRPTFRIQFSLRLEP